MNKPVLKIYVTLEQIMELCGTSGKVTMITFRGTCDCENFHGEIMPGAADTQIEKAGAPRTLSARYLLRGYDAKGQPCSLFIENNGVINQEGDLVTKPEIMTDSKCLSWLEQAPLKGKIIGIDEKHIEIRIWEEN